MACECLPDGGLDRLASCLPSLVSSSFCFLGSQEKHFSWEPKKQKLELTSEGKQLANRSNPPSGKHSHAMDKLYEHIEQALHAHHRFRLDQHYMVDPKTKKVVIID